MRDDESRQQSDSSGAGTASHFSTDNADTWNSNLDFHDALQHLRAATYRGRSTERFDAAQPALFRRYMAGSADGGPARWTVAPAVREHVAFAPHNLLEAPPAQAGYDLVMLRNVMIYFDEACQQRILAQVRKAMRPGARLILGEQESITRLRSAFAYEQAHVYRIDEETV